MSLAFTPGEDYVCGAGNITDFPEAHDPITLEGGTGWVIGGLGVPEAKLL